MFCIICTAEIWDHHMPKMEATVMTWDLCSTFTSAFRNISTRYQSKSRPHITLISYLIWQFIHNSSIYEQKSATSKLGWASSKLMRARNGRYIQSGKYLVQVTTILSQNRVQFCSKQIMLVLTPHLLPYLRCLPQAKPLPAFKQGFQFAGEIMRLQVILILNPLRWSIWQLLAWDNPNELRIWWILKIQIMMVQR